jgi:hypothetical protein
VVLALNSASGADKAAHKSIDAIKARIRAQHPTYSKRMQRTSRVH